MSNYDILSQENYVKCEKETDFMSHIFTVSTVGVFEQMKQFNLNIYFR